MKSVFLSLFFIFFLNSFSQKKITLYFEVNSSELSKNEFKKLSDFVKTKDLKVQKVIGYCDLRSSAEYSDTLALKRANFIANLIKLTTSNTVFELEFRGENFNQDKVLELTRKVEVYFKIEKSLSVKVTKDNELAEVVKKAKIGDKLVLKEMNFYDRTDMLYSESFKIREELLQVLKDNSKLKIQIQGHICCTLGKDEEEIALKRCMATYEYLVINGIDKSRLSYKSFDATQPLFPIPEKNEEQRKANRRVEILILDK